MGAETSPTPAKAGRATARSRAPRGRAVSARRQAAANPSAMGAEMTERTSSSRRVAAELGRIRRAHPTLADDLDAQSAMTRLAALQVVFAELQEAIAAAGGGAKADPGQVAELRQLHRQCLVTQRELRNWSQFKTPDGTADAILLMAQTRRQLIEAARARALEGQATPVPEAAPFSARALLKAQRDRDDDE
jgi:hypothetical protein